MQARQHCESPAGRLLHPALLPCLRLQLQMHLVGQDNSQLLLLSCRMDVLSGDLLLQIWATFWPSHAIRGLHVVAGAQQ